MRCIFDHAERRRRPRWHKQPEKTSLPGRAPDREPDKREHENDPEQIGQVSAAHGSEASGRTAKGSWNSRFSELKRWISPSDDLAGPEVNRDTGE